jgi:hypothetical protein
VKNDATYLAILLGLFALAFLLVVACDRIIASDSEAVDTTSLSGDPDPLSGGGDALEGVAA